MHSMHIRNESYIKSDRYNPTSHEGYQTKDLEYEDFDILPQESTCISPELLSENSARKSLNHTKQDERAFHEAERCDG